jgi:beta-glucosidase
MPRKNICLSLFLVFYVSPISSTEPQQQSWYNWITNFFETPIKQSKFQTAITQATANGKPLDLQSFYKDKEAAENFIDPKKSAAKFKKAIIEAAQKSILMARFKNHPEKFLFGASSSSYQYEGGLDETNANAIFYIAKGLPSADIAIDFWNRYQTDIVQMKNELGINAFRISIAWERVQPNKNTWDIEALAQYAHIIKTLKANGIEPIVVLHHYTIPQWFAEMGGFEKTENIFYFVEFAKKMYEALHEEITYWSTFNAIEGYAFKGYYTLDGPPGTKKGLFTTEKVMYNMLNAHAQVYKAIKGRSGLYNEYKKINPTTINPQIGIQKNIVLFDPFSRPDQGICEKKGSQVICGFSSLLNNTMFFKLLYYKYHDALDWIGLNIYSNMFMLYAQKQEEKDEERKTENLNYRDYPEGIYRAVKIISDKIAKPLNIPIIITENGIATKNDAQGNEKRTRFFRRALYTIRKLIEEGHNIIGYTPWASHDNYEWPSPKQPNPHDRPYGLFEVNFDKNSSDYLKRTLKPGAYYYRDFIKGYFGQQ